MDAVYRPEKLPCSKHISLKECFSRFSGLLSSQSIMNVGTSANSFQQCDTRNNRIDLNDPELLAGVSLELLNEDVKKADFWNTEDRIVLQTTQIRQNYQNKCPALKRPYPHMELYTSKTDVDYFSVQDGNITQNITNEFALNVRIYHPFELSINRERPNGYHRIKFSHEIVVLGSNTLADLRDKIMCLNDTCVFAEVSDPFGPPQPKLDPKQEYPSGFIFIDNVFYNDLRDPRSIDYSEVIIQWAKHKQIGPLNTASMEMTKISELKPRFGYPYVYQHQGKCEHLIVFTDAWLTSGDIKYSNYPLYKGINRFRNKRCGMCALVTAEWLALNCDRLPRVRFFLCTNCMSSYLYKGKQKIGTFSLYKILDKNDYV